MFLLFFHKSLVSDWLELEHRIVRDIFQYGRYLFFGQGPPVVHKNHISPGYPYILDIWLFVFDIGFRAQAQRKGKSIPNSTNLSESLTG